MHCGDSAPGTEPVSARRVERAGLNHSAEGIMPTTSTGTQRKSSARAAGSKGMDAIKLLKQDHREVEGLFETFEKARGDARKQKIATEICGMLKVHATVEEELFYPAVKEEIEESELIDEAQVEHNSAKQLIAENEGGSAGDELWEAKVKVLSEY